MKTENLKIGRIKNYKELCAILNIPVKAGNTKKAHYTLIFEITTLIFVILLDLYQFLPLIRQLFIPISYDIDTYYSYSECS